MLSSLQCLTNRNLKWLKVTVRLLLLSFQWYVHFTFIAVFCLVEGSILHSSTLSNHPSSPVSPLESERSRSTSSPPHHCPQAHSGETSLLSGLKPKTNLKGETATQKRMKEKQDNESPKPKPRPDDQFKGIQQEVNENIELSIEPKPNVELILSGESGIEEEEPMTVGQLFKDTVSRFPTHPALKYKEGGKWKTYTYTEYYDCCIRAAKSFLEVRVEIQWHFRKKHSCIIIKLV